MTGPGPDEATPIGALLGRGRVADVHAYGEQAIKLYHPGRPKTEAFAEAAILAVLEVHRLPTPRVHAAGSWEGRWGLVMDRIDGSTMGERALADASATGPLLDEMVRLQLLVHSSEEWRLRSLKAKLRDNIVRGQGLDPSFKERLLARLATMPDGNRLCHGDFHPFNIIGEGASITIVDWLDAASGPPVADACRSYLLLLLAAPAGFADAYLDRYAAASGTGAEEIRGWLPLLAAARLAEGTEGETATLIGMAQAGA